MSRVLDTARLPEAERLDAVDAAVRYAGLPAILRPEVDPAEFTARVDVWSTGGGTEFLRWSGNAYKIWRGHRQIGSSDAHRIAITAISPGRWSWQHPAAEEVRRTSEWDVLLVDHAAPYEFVQAAEGTTYAFNVDFADLGLTGQQIRHASAALRSSPLYRLVIQHMRASTPLLDKVAGTPAAALLGSATADLMRALVSSVAADRHAAPDDTSLLALMKLFIDRHATDRSLTPTAVARAHAVSVRKLYQVWESSEDSLAEYVMARRLASAQRLLASGSSDALTIADVARRSGFADPAHFSRRFRQAYGMSPREWRHSVGDIP